MPKISFIGDSIRIQYTPRVAELLGEDFEIFAPKENCRFAKYTLRGLFDWRNDMDGSRIVHWNNGLWDVCDLFGDGLFTSEEEYVSNMLRIADILQSRYEKVIFATSTPVSEKNMYNRNPDIKRYNDLIVPLLRRRGIIINDLYSAVIADLDKYISDDMIHLSEDGIALCSRMVADVIKDTAASLSHSTVSTKKSDFGDDGAPVIFG